MNTITEQVNTVDIHEMDVDNTKTSDIVLSTMTLDGLITNVKFDKMTAIEHLEMTTNIVEIGCNYGYMILEEYKSWPCYKDRMTKKQLRVEQRSGRKQGLGTHFNSQITFTIVSEKDSLHSYQVKLFTNGRVQIPGIGKLSKRNDELLEDILSIMCSYIMAYPDVLLLNKKNSVGVDYLTPILQNFKSITLMADDCMAETRVGIDKGVRYQIVPHLDLSALERAILLFKTNNRTPYPIDSITFNPERYSGMLVKFSTPQCITNNYKMDKFIEMVKLVYHKKATKSRQLKPTMQYTDYTPDRCLCVGECVEDCLSNRKMTRVVKQMQAYWYLNSKSIKRFRQKITTVKLFRSGRINLDHVNNHEQAYNIRQFIVKMIMDNWETVVYYVE